MAVEVDKTTIKAEELLDFLSRLAKEGHCVGIEFSPVSGNWYAWASYKPAARLYRVPFISTDDSTIEGAIEDLADALKETHFSPGRSSNRDMGNC